MTRTIVGLSGNLDRPSKTRALVQTAVATAASKFEAVGTVLDLTDFGPGLGAARQPGDLDPNGRAALDTLLAADALIVASPVYKGSYTGLFKHLIDLIDPQAFQGKPVLLAATGGGDRHALVIEHQLRPLFGFFEARTLPTGVYAADRDFVAGQPASDTLHTRLGRAVDQFALFFDRRSQPEVFVLSA
ncbi:FMN reductase [Tabrizicola sp. J26]|uniref:FMN reductase n=1 Tax=Alitabrizicola rongguiensis TaxID=2909234 RepID=UPI001F1999AA|nr:FMN reductase [Tabrizicola rongguiensis]MCF1709752.1 FMN reductase [Tabrizicola rongguiensis]